MKKITISALSTALFSTLLFIGISSCSSDEPVNIETNSKGLLSNLNSSHIRTLSEAYDIASRATSMFDDMGTPTSRGGKLRTIDINSPIKVISSKLSRSGAINDTLMYVVNYADSMGFAVISALKGAPELIAVTMKGNYDPSKPCDNPGFKMYMDNAAQVLSDGGFEIDTTRWDPGNRPQPVILEKTITDTIWSKRIAPKARVSWGQTNPEGWECPNGIAGCAITATAMGMCGLKYPTSIQLTYKAGSPELTLNWNELKKLKSWDQPRYDVYDNMTVSQTIAQLCRQLGYLAGTDYKANASGTTPEGLEKMLKKVGFTFSKGSVKQGTLATALQLNTAVLVGGFSSPYSSLGHIWLCDGVKQYKLRYRYCRSYDSGKTWETEATDYSQQYIYNFLNWGWDGSENGYFLDMDFSAYKYDVTYYTLKKS